MNQQDQFLQTLDQIIHSVTFDRSQVLELEEILDERAPKVHSHGVAEVQGITDLIDSRIKQCKVTMNQVTGLNDAIENSLLVQDQIKYIVPQARGSFIPNRVLTIDLAPATVSIVRLVVTGYDAVTGDTYSTTINATVKRFGDNVSVIGDPVVSTVADPAVSKWKAAIVANSAKGGLTVLVCSDSAKEVIWKIVADVF